MAHKTLISGTAYSVTGGRELIGGTGYGCKAGKTIIGGTAFTVPFSKGIPLSTITPGAILYLNESGSPVPFYIAKHDYESGLNGAGRTLVVRKDCYDMCVFSNSSNAYANSVLDSLFCNTYIKLLDAGVQTAIGKTKFYYTPGNGNTTMVTLQRAVFQLSVTELGKTGNNANIEGDVLPIASMLQIAYRNGSAVGQWTRTPYKPDIYRVYYVAARNILDAVSYTLKFEAGSRPAFTLPGNLGLAQNPDGTYTLAA